MKNNESSAKFTYFKWQLLLELRNPVFYITGIIFALFVTINFYIRQRFFTGYGSTDLLLYFNTVPYICILIIPVLCYKRSSNNYNSFIPLKIIDKVLLRHLSLLSLFTIYLLMLVPAALLINLFGSIDVGQFFTSFLCLILYGASVIALTLFIGELFESSILSFIISALFLGIINSSHLFTTYIKCNAFFNSLFKALSFTWHFDAAGKGIIDTRDFIWFIFSVPLFLFAASLVREIKNGKNYSIFEKINHSLFFVLLILIIANGSRWYTRLDFSKNKTFSLSQYTKTLLSNIDTQVKITYYRSNSLARIYPQVRDVSDYLNTYSSQNKKISFLIVDPEKDSKTSQMLEEYGITSQPFVNATKNSTEYTNVYSAIVIEYKGNYEVIPFLISTDTIEYDLDGRINHLVNNKSRTVNIVIGNGLSFSEDYSYLVPWLNSQGFICNPLFIEDSYFVESLDASSGPLLVIGDSKMNIEAAAAIENYILLEKGNAIFTVSPFDCDIFGNWNLSLNYTNHIIDMLENWGINFSNRIVGDISCSRITMSSSETDQQTGVEGSIYTRVLNYPLWINVLPQQNTKQGINLSWVPELIVSGNAKPYLYSSTASWTYEINPEYPDKLIETNPFILEENGYTMDNTNKILAAKIEGSLTGLYNLYSCENSNIVVIPDQYFLHSLMTGYTGETKNFYFITNTLLKMNEEFELAEIQDKTTKNTSLFKISDEVDLSSKKACTYAVCFGVVPAAGILLCLIFIFMLFRKLQNAKKIYN